MKNIFTTLCIVFFMSQSLRAQQNTNFVDDSNIWYSYGGYYSALSGTDYVSITHFYSGDTTINNLSYKKMFSLRLDTSKVWVSETEQADVPSRSIRYEAAFRQQATSVYFVLPDETIENLYIDFDLNIGDTVSPHYYGFNSGKDTTIVVSSIITTPFGSTSRKEFILSNGRSVYDGIGYGLGFFKGTWIAVHGDVYLVCFQQDGIQQNVYQFSEPSPECKPTVVPTVISERLNISDNFNIYPNPFIHSAHIDFLNGANKAHTLKMYNITGKCVKTIYSLNQNNNIINRDQLDAGIYFIEITSEENSQIYYGKIIIR